MAGNPSTNTLLQISNGDSPETFTTIEELGDINGTNYSASEHDTSTHSLGTPWSTMIMGLLKHEKLTFPINYDPTLETHKFATSSPAVGLGYLFANRIKKKYRLVPIGFETHATEFEAYVSAFSRSFPVDGVMKAQVSLSPTGAPTEDVDAS